MFEPFSVLTVITVIMLNIQNEIFVSMARLLLDFNSS